MVNAKACRECGTHMFSEVFGIAQLPKYALKNTKKNIEMRICMVRRFPLLYIDIWYHHTVKKKYRNATSVLSHIILFISFLHGVVFNITKWLKRLCRWHDFGSCCTSGVSQNKNDMQFINWILVVLLFTMKCFFRI